MNTGAFGEGFPYTNFHDLNMDWLIKIAKDFLDQYTNIQNIISTGEDSLENHTTADLARLQEKADELEALLNQWYATHSNDIADELASSLQDFSIEATRIAQEASSSIPQDYSALSDSVIDLRKDVDNFYDNIVDLSTFSSIETGGVQFTKLNDSSIKANGTAVRNIVLRLAENITGIDRITIKGGATGGTSTTYCWCLYNADTGSRVDNVASPDVEKTIELNPNVTYFLAIVIFNGTTVTNAVFTPKAYTTGIINDIFSSLKTISNRLMNTYVRYRYFSGCLFIAECGEHIYIDAVAFRLYDKINNLYTTASTGTFILAGNYTAVNYIKFDGTNYSRSTSYDDTAIAYVYERKVYPLVDGIIPNYRQIQPGYLRSGSAYYLNFERTPIDGYCKYDSPDVKLSERGYKLVTTGSHTYNMPLTSVIFEITENTANINNKKILMIGDSFIKRGYLQNYLKQFNNTLSFIGTKTTTHYDFKCEGISGARLWEFTKLSSSPFMFNNSLNFSRYLSANQLDAPDMVVINCAINHGTYEDNEYGSYYENLIELVNMIRTYSQNIKIYVTYGANYAMKPGSTYGYPSRRYEEVRKCCNSVYDVSNIIVIPIDSALIDELDYPYQDYTYFSNTIKILSDCVHPTETEGFQKMAQMIYNYLGL